MNMKKALAGLSAGLVAVSAMATTAFAEETNINLFAWDYQTNTYKTSVNVYGDYGYLNNGDHMEFALYFSDEDSLNEINEVKVNGYTAYPYAVLAPVYHEGDNDATADVVENGYYLDEIVKKDAIDWWGMNDAERAAFLKSVKVAYYCLNVGAFGSNAYNDFTGFVDAGLNGASIPAGRYDALDITVVCKEGDATNNKNELKVNQYWGDATRLYFRAVSIAGNTYGSGCGDLTGVSLQNIWGNANASNWVLNLVKETSARTNIAWGSLTSYDMTVANTNALKAAKTAKLVLTLNADVKDALAKVKVTSVWNNANDYQDGDVNWNIASETTAYAVGAIGNTLTIELPVEAVYSAAYDKVVEALKFEVIDTSADFGNGTSNDLKSANIVSAVITVSNDESEVIDVEEPIEPKPDDEDEITVDDDKTDTEEPADTNPGTGAAIALVPVVLAAAAAVVAKRK